MKVNHMSSPETVVNQNDRKQVQGKEGEEKQAKVKNGAIKASDLNLIQDPIEEKKKKAMEEAMGFIKRQFDSDGMVDDILDECRKEIADSKSDAKEAAYELGEIRKQKEELKKEYLDPEDEEYKMRLKALNEEAGEWQKQYDQANQMIAANTHGIKGIKQDMLKYHGMVDANKAAEKSRKASSDEIIGMLKDEAIDKIDEDMEEVIEEAKEKREENLEKEAEQEEIRAEREKAAQKIEEEMEEEKKRAQKSYVPRGTLLDTNELLDKQQEINRNTQEILQQQKLLEEDIKGILVDSQL